MIIKEIRNGVDAREKLIAGVRAIADCVNSSIGPSGSTSLIEDETIPGSFKISKDGTSIANSINLYDPVENLAVQMVKQAADRTATGAGDGTSATVCLIDAIITQAQRFIAVDTNVTEVNRHILEIGRQLDKELTRQSKKLTKKRLLDVATISSNNDPILGKTVANAYSKAKSVTVARSQSTETYIKTDIGIKIDRGLSSHHQVNNPSTNEAILEDVYVFMSDWELKDLKKIQEPLSEIIKMKKSVLFICNIDNKTLATINRNVSTKIEGESVLKGAHILPPDFGLRSSQLMEDLSKVTGGRFISQKTGDNLENITLADFGRVNKVIVGEDSTVMIPLFEFNEVTNEYIKSLNTIKSGIVDKNEINFYNERISKIDGGISTIFIGGNSTIEQTETFDRAEDAVLAVKSAVEEGTLSGGGIGLINASASIQDSDDNNKQVAVEIMIQALREPFRRIVLNTGVDVEEVSRRIISENKVGFGYNAKNGEFGLMEEMGVIDAARVTKSALKNAISVATTILSTNTIVSNKRAE